MKLTTPQLALINLVLQVDKEGKAKQFPMAELTTAMDIFKEIKKCVKDDKFIDGEIKLSSEQKVFITKLLNDRDWGVMDAESIFALIELLK